MKYGILVYKWNCFYLLIRDIEFTSLSFSSVLVSSKCSVTLCEMNIGCVLTNAPNSPLNVCVLSHVWLFRSPVDCSLPGSSVHGDFQARILGVGCHVLLQGIFQTQGSNPPLLHLLHWQVDSLPLRHQGSPTPILGTIYSSPNMLKPSSLAPLSMVSSLSKAAHPLKCLANLRLWFRFSSDPCSFRKLFWSCPAGPSPVHL